MPGSLISNWMQQRRLHRYARLAGTVHEVQALFRGFSSEQLQAERLSLSLQVRSGRYLREVVPRSFALVREAARRTVGIEHFDVQLLGGYALAEGQISEMATGEGKTFAATLPLFLFALYERGAHLVTANDYLAERDASWVQPLFELLGLRVGFIVQKSTPAERASAYQCDLTYGTLREFAFDFLRDRLRRAQIDETSLPVDPEHMFSTPASEWDRIDKPFFLLVDEADSLLIDEARTPMIISLPASHDPALSDESYLWAADAAGNFQELRDYELAPVERSVRLTRAGRERLQNQLRPNTLVELTLQEVEEVLGRAISARVNFRRNEDYLIADDQIRLIDEFTGRITEGRQLRHGMHQAIEALEGVTLTRAQEPAARITVQDFIARYPHIAGMTGTASEVARELKTYFGCHVIPIPTNRPCCREILPIKIFESNQEKYLAIAQEIRSQTGRGRPVLIGTRTIRHSHHLSEFLQSSGIEHALLNGVQDRDEADIVAQAGQHANVTVATNMAGRGTDIVLSDDVRAAGGLHVIATEFHESARIDRQLAGRAARQGDPGSFQQMASFEDTLFAEAWGSEVASELIQSARNGFRLSYAVSLFRQAQQDLERRHRRERALLVESERQRRIRNLEMGRDPWLDDLH